MPIQPPLFDLALAALAEATRFDHPADAGRQIIEGFENLRGIEPKVEKAICVVCGYVAGMLMGFNGYLWSQAVIVEVYAISVLSLAGCLIFLMRWMHATHQRRYLYWSVFWLGICFTNHQTLLVAALGIEVAVLARDVKLGRDVFFEIGRAHV